MLGKKNNFIKDEQGSALLVVVIIMSIIFIMSSLVLGYSIKTYKVMKSYNDIIYAEELADSAFNEVLVTLTDKIDAGELVESYTVDNTMPFAGEDDYSFSGQVHAETFYDPLDFIVSGNVKDYRILRSVVTGEVLTFGNIAFEVKGTYKDINVVRKGLVTIETTGDDYFEIHVYRCLE